MFNPKTEQVVERMIEAYRQGDDKTKARLLSIVVRLQNKVKHG